MVPELTVEGALGAIVLVLLPLGLVWWQGLGLTGGLMLAMGRALLQLVVLAYGLAFVFAVPGGWAVLGFLGLLWAIASKLLLGRLGSELPGVTWLGVGALGLTLLPVAYGIWVVVRPVAGLSPPLWVPLGAAVLAQGVQSGGAAGEFCLRSLQRQRGEIEAMLCAGARPAQAVRELRRGAMRAGLAPLVQNLAIAGLATVPLWMGGLLFAGMDPLVAVVYELLLGLLLVCSGAIVSVGLVLGLEKLVFTPLMQLREFS